MSDERLQAVKEEIRFFMEKSFQVSFGYVGALVALAAAIKFDVLVDVARASGMGQGVLLSCALVVVNNVYSTVAVACLFAILKRGYFILTSTPPSAEAQVSIHRQWEIYVRSSSNCLFASPSLNGLAWNVDNYYMLPVFALIQAVSVGAVVYPWCVESPLLIRIAIVLLYFMNLVVIVPFPVHNLRAFHNQAAL